MIFIAICSCLLTLTGGKVNPDIEAGESVNIIMCVCVCVCVCLCMCVCVFTSIYREGFIFLELEFQGIYQRCYAFIATLL